MKKLPSGRFYLKFRFLLFFVLPLTIYNHAYSQVTAGDCSTATNICTNANFSIDPNGFGTINELGDGFSTGLISNPNMNPNTVAAQGFANSGCLMSGELNSTWMIINIASNGALEFSFGADNGVNCYDWAMWQYDAATCGAIIGNTLPPVACNWNGLCEGFTGMAGGPNGSALPPGAGQDNFEDALNVLCGEQYIVCFSNFSSAVTNVPLNFFGSATVACNTFNPIIVNDETICEGTSATLTATGGITYAWTPGGDLSATTGSTVTATPPAPGSYDYYVTGTGACGVGVDTSTVTVIPVFDPTITPVGPYSPTDPPIILTAVDGGGTWSSNCGACINSVTGQFDPSVAGIGTWTICYDVGTTPCDMTDCIDIIVECTSPVLDPIAAVNACDTYVLLIITGTDLSGNEAYYSGAGGTGTQYNAGSIISTTTTLFVFDEASAGSTCNDELSFTITIDNTPPIINCPGNLTAVCSLTEQPSYSNYAAFTAAGGSASDETSLNTASFTMTSEVSNGLTCPEIITRTYEISDACGHTSTCTQTITIHDLIAPVFASAPTNVNVQCTGDIPAMTNLGWTDNCDGAGSVAGTDVSNGLSCPETITRTWTYTDACGNISATETQIITVDDTQAPVLAAPPADITVECVGDVPLLVDLNYTDNCDAPGTVTGTDGALIGGPCGGTIIRTWTFTDACGNNVTVTQTITVDDTTPPTASNLPPQVGVPTPVNILDVFDEADNCGVPTVVHVSDISDGGSCPEIITRTYSVTDACGNQILVTQTFTIGDAVLPTASDPTAVNVECFADIPATDPLVVTDEADNGTTPVVIWEDDISDGLSCPETIARRYRVTDNCGNFIFVTQTITVLDVTAPVLAAAPSAANVQCIGDVPAMTNLGWTDNCDGAGSIAGTDVSDGLSCPETITRTWTYTDACGNISATETQIITVHDTQAPVLAAPPVDITVECVGDVPIMVDLNYTDNCDAPGTVTGTDGALIGGPCGGTIIRTWTFTDACGNNVTVTQTITVDDTTPPTASNLPPQVGTPTPVNILDVFDEADNCGVPTVVHVSDISDGGSCPEIITRTYSVTDACGNQILVTQTFTIGDAILPTASNPTAVNVECFADIPATDPLVVTDEADNGITPIVTWEDDISNGLSCPETIARRYRVTDNCGNFIFVTQTITVLDVTAPVLAAAPAAANVQCIGDVPAMTNLGWTDNCDGAGSIAGIDVSDGLSCPETITRTWTYTDACGNISATETQIITVDDTTPPTASNLPPQAGTPTPVNILDVFDEADNCGVPTVVHVSDISDGGNCPEIITRTYSVTDACGNQILVTQTFTIGDAITPTASNPTAVNVECSANIPATDPLVVTDESDNGATPVVTWEDDTSDGLSCPETIARRYRVTDDCGNFIFVTQTITILDLTAPVMDAPPVAAAVQCIGDVPAMTDLGYTDNCDPAGTVTGADVSDGLSCPETITRSWTWTDACGNVAATVTQLITVHDTQAPIIAGTPGAVTVQCIGDVPAMIDLNYTDNCDPAGTVTGADVSDGLSCPETITRSWTWTDACGNVAATATQIITVHDTQAPVFAAPPVDLTVECIGDVPVMTNLGYTDNCDPSGNVAGIDGALIGGACGGIITRTWSFTDACGNNATVTQTITIDDTTPPTASNPATTTVPGGPIPPVDITVVIDEADNCTANPVVAFVSESSDNNPCPETITRIYSVTDDCGNTINVTHLIMITDPILPTATAPAPINVECIGQVPLPDPLVITDEVDNQGVPTVAYVGDISDGLSCPETITRTYSITDVCGNVITVDQIITVLDITAPTASNPATINVECIGDVPLSDITVVNDEADNCTVNPVVAHVGDVSDGALCPETITRTYSITDDCGNEFMVDQLIIVNDVTPPTGTAPAVVNVECIGDVPLADVSLITNEADNCTVNPVVAHVGDVSDGLSCPETITRTYSITDDCGNQITVDQLIIVNDVTPPTASNPAQVIVQLATQVPVPDITVVIDELDNCTVNPIVAYVGDISDGINCPETITRTYTVTDDCGNQITVTQTIIISDITDPTASAPVPVNVECIGDVPVSDVTVVTDESDNSGVATVAYVGDVSDGLSCPETITRTYSITDDCGNVITVNQIITVNDVTNPTASAPATVNVECIGDVPLSDITIVNDEADNCTVNPVVIHEGDVSDGLSCPETITRTYSVTDDCGNQITVDQLIIVNDVTPPTGTAPATVNVECIGDVPAADVLLIINEADNCTVNPVVVHVGDISDGLSCPETITRTYSITDDCGNQITVDQLIIVNDITPPTGINVPGIDVPGSMDVPLPDPLVVTTEADNCTANPVVAWVSDVSDGNICNLEKITRTYSITDDCGNQITVTQVITILAVPAPIDAGPDQLICLGSQANVVATNPWNVPIVWDPLGPDGTVSPAVTTVYTVTADNLGCISTDDMTVVVEELPVVSFLGDDLDGCEPHTVNFTNTSTTSSSLVECVWSFSDGGSTTGCGSVSHTFQSGGLYDVTLTTTSENGCVNTETYTDYIYVEEYAVAEFTPSQTQLTNIYTEVAFTNNSQNATDYAWDFGYNTTNSIEVSPTHTFPEDQGGSYLVELIATTPLGCADTAYATINISEEVIYYIPNTFTPDNDSYNQYFQPIFTSGYDPYDFNLYIFNRWGEVIWESHDTTVGWDGTFGASQDLVQDGTYTWKIDFKTTETDKRLMATGHVNVIR